MTRKRPPPDLTSQGWKEPDPHLTRGMGRDVTLDCGWGRVIFGQTFDEPSDALEPLRAEEPGSRDICLYLRDPHIVVGKAPHELFIDPSFTYRLPLHHYRPSRKNKTTVDVRALRSTQDAEEINRLYAACGMLSAPVSTLWANQRTHTFIYLVAEDPNTGRIVGTVTGVDHVNAFNDPEGGASLWCLAVDPQCTIPGVGKALARTLAERFISRGRSYLDLSVLADNDPAIRLYEKLGFERVPILAVKRKNPINEPLFTAPDARMDELNPYARIIGDEARRRGIAVEIVDAQGGFMRLSSGGREILTRESLSELTSAVSMSMCDDKRVTRRVLAEAGLSVPPGREATFDDADVLFMKEHGEVVVKPARGEQGKGITVGVTDAAALERALEYAAAHCPDVLIEALVHGDDLRIVVIDHEVVAAAIREPATVVGTGADPISGLIAAQSRRRSAATGGESSIPIDDATVEAITAAGFTLDDVLPAGRELRVRRTANLHTGGTIHDVTAALAPDLAEVAVRASHALAIPVVGLDLMVPSHQGSEYAVIEANERPGLANHEPQPTAERFIDLLFPSTTGVPKHWTPALPGADHG